MLYVTFSRCTTQIQRNVKIFVFKKKPEVLIYCSILAHTIYLPLTVIDSEDSAAGDDLRMQDLYIAYYFGQG